MPIEEIIRMMVSKTGLVRIDLSLTIDGKKYNVSSYWVSADVLLRIDVRMEDSHES